MITIISLITLLLIIIFSFLAYKYEDSAIVFISLLILIPLEIIILIILLNNVSSFQEYMISNQKIQMYEEENTKIENQISAIIENYKTYENNTYAQSLGKIDLSNDKIIVLTQLYPELKSNEMVTKQIEIYSNNNDKIKELKEQRLENGVSKWWLYFGNINEGE